MQGCGEEKRPHRGRAAAYRPVETITIAPQSRKPGLGGEAGLGPGRGSAERRAEIGKGREGRVRPTEAAGSPGKGRTGPEGGGWGQDPTCVEETGPVSGPNCPGGNFLPG